MAQNKKRINHGRSNKTVKDEEEADTFKSKKDKIKMKSLAIYHRCSFVSVGEIKSREF